MSTVETAYLKFKRSDYLPHQWEMLTSKRKIVGLVAGLGSGKTYVFLRQTLDCLINKRGVGGKSNGWIIYPTFSLAEELFIEPFKELLDKVNIKYKYSSYRKRFYTQYGTLKIYQLQKPERMVGSNLTFIGFDEFDIELQKRCKQAYKKALGRLRGCVNPRLYIVTTPEGFLETYNIFVKEINSSKHLIHARSYDNPYLPEGYIETLEREYDKKLLDAYLNGNFVNLTAGNVYYGFNRSNNVPRETLILDQALPICLCVDFNVNPMVWEIVQIKDKDIRVIKEIKGTNVSTWDMCNMVKQYLPERKYHLQIYGDASGTARDTRSLQTDYTIIDTELKDYFLSVEYNVPKANPPVRSRINAVNARLSKNNVLINNDCIELIEDFEQIVYNDKGDMDKSNFKRTHASDAFGYLVVVEFPIIVERQKASIVIK